MLDHRLDEGLRSRLIAAPVDWRNAWAGPSSPGEVVAWPAAVAEAVGLPALDGATPATLTTPLEPLRRLPAHASEMVSELRGGEFLTRLLREGEWWLVAAEDGYVGWAHEWVLVEQSVAEREELLARRLGLYAAPRGTLWSSDHHAAGPLWLGMPLLRPAEEAPRREGLRLVELAHGDSGWIPTRDILPATAGGVEAVLRAARALLGSPYRWGGCSPGGLDCSGFVQLVWRWGGVALPRDAAQQARVGRAVGTRASDWSCGDLLLYGDPADHVGLYDGRGGILHCRGRVRREALTEIAPLQTRLATVRRVDPPREPATPTLWLPSPDSSR